MRSVRVIVTGRVQGVGFRAWVENEALMRELDGWVRNRRDGTVEALFSGADDAVRGMLEACRAGPTAAHVEAVREFPTPQPAQGGFAVRPTK